MSFTQANKAEKIVFIATLVLLATALLFPFRRAFYIREGGIAKADLGPFLIFTRPSTEAAYAAIFSHNLPSDFYSWSRLGTEVDYGRTFLVAAAILALAGTSLLVIRANKA